MPKCILILTFILMSLAGCQRVDAAFKRTDIPLSSTQPPEPVGQNGTWEMIFNDEFDSHALDAGKWTTCYWWDAEGCTIATTGELEWYLPENVIVRDGTVKLRAQEQTVEASNGETYNYTSGMISTGRDHWETTAPTRFIFQYGYAEIRARVPAGQGLWPAFWMLPDDHDSLPEIDIVEILGHEPDTIYFHIHYGTGSGGKADKANHVWVGPDFSADWHTFAVDWQPDAITWYVDGVEQWRFTEPRHIPAEPMYLILNLAVGGEWPGAPDNSTTFPAFYEIDYVRVWQPVDETAHSSTATAIAANPTGEMKTATSASTPVATVVAANTITPVATVSAPQTLCTMLTCVFLPMIVK